MSAQPPLKVLETHGASLTPDGGKTRSGLSCGRYLFFNRLQHRFMRPFDALTGLSRSLSARMPASLEPKRVLLCMQAHIGDLLYATAAIPVVRKAFPDARIDFLVHPTAAHLLAGHPDIGQIHEINHWKLDRSTRPMWQKLLSYLQQRRRVIKALRDADYALAIDLYAYFPNSIPLLRASGIPLRLGWASGGFGGLLSHARDWDCRGQHVLDWHRKLLATLPACRPHTGLARTSLPAAPEAFARARALLQQAGAGDDYLCLHIGAGGAHRQWGEQAWIELARECAGFAKPIVLLGFGPVEEVLAARIATAAPGCINLAGRLTFSELSAVIAQTRLFVGLDSMAAHLAAAHDVPLVGIFPGIMDGTWKPVSGQARIVITPTPCSPCFLPDGCPSMSCLRQTGVREVMSAITSLIYRHRESRHV